jgi:hypothetical protein
MMIVSIKRTDWCRVQIKKRFFVTLIFISPLTLFSQSTLFQQGTKDYLLMERLDIKVQVDSNLAFSSLKPFNRKWWSESLQSAEAHAGSLRLSSIDRYNLERSKLNNWEWSVQADSAFPSKRPVLKNFYRDPANLLRVSRNDFFLSVNPIFQLQFMKENQSDRMLLFNSRGLAVRSQVGKRIGLQFYLTETQERAPEFASTRFATYRAVPGAGVYKSDEKTGYDWMDARGSLYVQAAKYLDVQLGHDKIFIGNGYRSLFFSDQSASHAYLNLNLRVWKFNYSSRVMELQPQYTRRSLGNDTLLWKKYAAIHYLSIAPLKWLTVGLFEGVVYGRMNRFEINYLNPIIFLRTAELNVGSPDNSFIGFDFKANLAKRMQVYGQVMIDELYTRFIREKKGWWGNKWAFQGGLKYIDLFGVNNLDVQLEANWIRPFTYSHVDTVANYTHFNQPLAHPLLSHVKEHIAIVRYQPAPRWYMHLKWIGWSSGSDVNGLNYGNSIFRSNETRALSEGVFYFVPEKRKGKNIQVWAAYEPRENLFIETALSYRSLSGTSNAVFGSIGVRFNMQRREYDY